MHGAALAASILCCAPVAQAQYAGPAVTQPPVAAAADAHAAIPELRETPIMPGDVISIATYGAPELTTMFQTSSGGVNAGTNSNALQGIKVGSGGEILLPYLGAVHVAGLTPTQLAQHLGSALKEGGYLVDPQVSVELLDSPTRTVTVLGEVLKPAPIPAFGQLRLLDAIAACGGLTPMASHSIIVRRVGVAQPIHIELGVNAGDADLSDIPLQTGDTVLVPKVGVVSVLGYVKTPSAIPMGGNAPITVLRALALAGGVEYGAGLSKARIIRTTADNQQVEIHLDLRKIMFGKQQDVVLMANDILMVPANAFKAGMAAGGAGVVASLLYGVSDTATIFK